MNRTPIEWCRTYAADGSFEEGFSVNPVRFLPYGKSYPNGRLVTMCQKVSSGCTHCYAETITRRFWPKDAAVPFPGYTAAGVAAGEFVLDERTLLSVLRRKKPARIFWGDMTDMFQESVSDAFLDRCFAVCALKPHLTHMFLTKRPERYLEYFSGDMGRIREALIGQQVSQIHLARTGNPVSEWAGLPMPNVWLGTSVESKKHEDRINVLSLVSAALKFLSLEPLLEDLGEVDLTCVDWVIVGGESGPGARPMHPDWVRNLRDQCSTGVPFFFKQWGAFGAGSVLATTGEQVFRRFENKQQWTHKGDTWINGGICIDAAGRVLKIGGDFDTCMYPVTIMHPMPKKAAGALLGGVEYREFPAVTA